MEHEILPISNRTAFARADIIDYFQGEEALFQAEKVLFEKLLPEIVDSRILDLGVGGGRTTKYLLEISRKYTGVDYVQQFVDETRRKFPNARILVGDARNLKAFADQSFDFVLFSFNGIDCISHEDRLMALGEIHRILSSGGIFMFSSHNRDYKYFKKHPWQRKIEFDAKFFRFFFYSLYHLPKHRAMKKHEISVEDYAVANDSDHRYAFLLYYITIEKQLKQLVEVGFSDIEAYDNEGKLVNSDISSHWIYYSARKK